MIIIIIIAKEKIQTIQLELESFLQKEWWLVHPVHKT